MKRITSILVLHFLTITAFAQLSNKPPKATINNAKSIQAKRPVTKDTVVKKTVLLEPVLSAAEKRRKNTLDALSFMLSNFYMIDSDFQERFDALADKKQYISYLPEADTAATVLIKNRYNHTVHKLLISFDSVNVKRIKQYSPVKQNEYADNKNSKWTNQFANSFVFRYDSNGRIEEITSAYKGWETTAHHVTKFMFTYKGNYPDSVVNKDNMNRTRSVAYFNGKLLADSIYFYSYTLPEGVVFLNNKEIYFNQGPKDRIKMHSLEERGYDNYRFLLDSVGKIILSEKRVKNPHYEVENVIINTYNIDSTGLNTGKTYQYSTGTLHENTDSLMGKVIPSFSVFTFNQNGQVIKEYITYHDKCIDSEETVTYTIGEFGFVTESKSVKNVKTKCRD